jgi:uncharacterized protein YkwD
VSTTRAHRVRRIAWLALPTLVALTISVPAAAAHPKRHHHRHHRHHASKAQVQVAPVQVTPAQVTPATCANADTSAVGAPQQTMRAAVVCLINQQRGQRKLPLLTEASELDHSAQGWTDSMVLHNLFSHGTDFWNRISAVGYLWSNVGENIASGFATPREVVTAWMASPDHCTNILNPNYANVGTGVNPNPVLAAASGAATWTQDFGLLMSQNPPSNNFGPAHGCPY